MYYHIFLSILPLQTAHNSFTGSSFRSYDVVPIITTSLCEERFIVPSDIVIRFLITCTSGVRQHSDMVVNPVKSARIRCTA
ncbi:MAG: hypothetical protein ACYDAJ_06525 [Nitrosotalea sp.]